MKSVILALLVLLVFSQGKALRCHCGGKDKICSRDVETCVGRNKVCASIILTPGPFAKSFQSCYDEDDCELLINSSVGFGKCCKEDLCND